VTGPPAERPFHTDPGGLQARADGQQVEVRSYEGELLRIMPMAQARQLVERGLADEMKHCVRVKLGIRWLSPRFDRPSGRPDLELMQRRDPQRYAALWRGNHEAHVGKGSLGRKVADSTVHNPPTGDQRREGSSSADSKQPD
jgi:hypothetical protein